MAVFGTLLSGCGEGKSEKESGGSGQADVDVESYDFSQDKSFDITAGGIQAAEDTVTLAMQKMADEVKEKSGGTITITVSSGGAAWRCDESDGGSIPGNPGDVRGCRFLAFHICG